MSPKYFLVTGNSDISIVAIHDKEYTCQVLCQLGIISADMG